MRVKLVVNFKTEEFHFVFCSSLIYCSFQFSAKNAED